jgi:hypothetical protein
VALLVASAASCLLRPHGVEGPRELLSPVLWPVSRVLSLASLSVRRNATAAWGGPVDDETARQWLQDNEAVQRQLAQYWAKLQERQTASSWQYMLSQQGQLEQAERWMRAMPREFPCLIVPAQVVAGSATPYQRTRALRVRQAGAAVGDYVTTRTVMTNRSTALPGMPAVLSASAVVGQIVSSGAWTAHLQLVTDPDFHLYGFVQRVFDPRHPRPIEVMDANSGPPRRRSLSEKDGPVSVYLTGCGDGLVSRPLSEGHAIAPGDLVLTMGEDGRLPMAIVIGRVRAVEPVPDSARHVRLKIEPDAQLATLEDVYIVLPQTREVAP